MLPDFENMTVPWNIFYYSDKKDQLNSAEAVFVKDFCMQYGDIVKLTILNCDRNKDVCINNKIKEPILKLHYGKNQSKNIKIYQGLKPDFLLKQNMKVMPNYVHNIT